MKIKKCFTLILAITRAALSTGGRAKSKFLAAEQRAKKNPPMLPSSRPVQALRLVCALILAAAWLVLGSGTASALVLVSGTVKDNLATPFDGAEVQAIDSSTQQIIVTTLTDPSGAYSLSLVPGVYDLKALPLGSGFQAVTFTSQNITADTTLNFILVPPATAITVSGTITDGDGNLVASPISVGLETSQSGGVWSSVFTTTGFYSISLAPGTYLLSLWAGALTPAHVPVVFTIDSQSPGGVLAFSQDTVMDITIKAKKVSVHVQDAAGNPVSNVRVESSSVSNPGLTLDTSLGALPAAGNSMAAASQTSASGDLDYWLFPTPAGQFYSFKATPPPGAPFLETSIQGVSVTGDTSVTITLNPAIIISGTIQDGDGNLVASPISVGLETSPSGGVWSSVFTTTGFYSISLAPGSYLLSLWAGALTPAHVPVVFNIASQSPGGVLTFSQDTVMDITINAKKVAVHVQDTAGNPIPNVSVQSSSVSNTGLTLNTALGVLPASGNSMAAASQTSASGDLDYWLFPTPDGEFYSFTANPPGDLPLLPFTVQGVVVVDDITLVIQLEFIHPPPVTIATTTPQPNAQGQFAGPVTVSLSATAAPGFIVATTKFTVDGGATQTYTGPYVVSGTGPHIVRFWSIDNLGVQETPKNLNLTIIAANPPENPGDLYPIALNAASLAGVVPGALLPDIFNGSQPGNFGWLTWAGSPNVPTLVASLTPPGNSSTYVNPANAADHVISIGDWVQGSPGVSNSSNVPNALDTLKTIDINVPIWDQASGNGNNTLYRVAGFARVRIISYQLPGQNRITARYLGLAHP